MKILALFALLACPILARAGGPVQPFVLSSPNGAFELEVAPLQASPVGDCMYRLRHAGELTWEVTRPFVLWEGVLSDAGVTLGFALTRTNGPGRGEQEVTIWRIGAHGEARVLEALRQRSPRMMHGSMSPFMHGLWLDSSQTLGVAHYSDYDLFSPEKREHFLAFELATGEEVPLAWTAETPRDGIWSIEDGKRPLVELQAAPEPLPFQPVLLGRTALLTSVPQTAPENPATGPVRDVAAFEPLADGGFELVTCEREYEPFHIQRVDASGAPVGAARVLDLDLDPSRALFLRFPNGAWLVSNPNYVFISDNETYWVDADPSKEPVQLPEEGLPVFEALSLFGPEQFIALGSRQARDASSVQFSLGRYSIAGEILWEVPLEGWREGWIENDPFPRYELAVRGEGETRELFVLRGRKRVIEVFSPSGKALRKIDLPTSTGRMLPSIYPDDRTDDPQALVSLTVAPNGELLVGGFEATDGLLRIGARRPPRQSCLGRIDLELPSGAQGDALVRRLRPGPNGALWSTDGNVVVRFESDGSLSRVFGTPREARLDPESLSASIDSRGWIFTGPEDLGPFFMTDRTGAERGRVAPPSEFAPDSMEVKHFSHDASGRLFSSRYLRGPILDPDGASWEFSSAGDLTRWVDHGLLRTSITTSPEHKGDVWVGLEHDASQRANTMTCLDTELHVLARTSRRPDGNFYDNIADIRTGPRGTVAILERDYGSGPNILTLTTTSFETGTSVQLAGRWADLIAVAAPWALVDAGSEELLVHVETGRFHSVASPPELEGRRILTSGLAPEGDELWYVTAEPLELWRYSLPALP